MIKIKNCSKLDQSISGIPKFKPLEEREVPENIAERLLLNPNFKKVIEKKESEKKTKSKNEK